MAKQPKKYMDRAYRIIDSWSERLQAQTPNHLGKYPFVYVDFKQVNIDKNRGDKVRDLMIGINTMTGERNASVQHPLTYVNFQKFCLLIKQVASKAFPMGEERCIEFREPKWQNNQRSQELYLTSALVLGKDQDGVYMTIRVPNRNDIPNIYFQPAQNFPVTDQTGKQLNNHENSALHAISVAESFQSVVEYLMTHHYMDEQDYDNKKEQNKRDAWQRQQQKNGAAPANRPNYNNSAPAQNQTYNVSSTPPQTASQDFDDDLPF